MLEVTKGQCSLKTRPETLFEKLDHPRQIGCVRAVHTIGPLSGLLFKEQNWPTFGKASTVGGHEKLPIGGQENCPLVAIRSARFFF